MPITSVTKLGGEMKLSRNSATYDAPTWVPGNIVMDNDHDESVAGVPANNRGNFPYNVFVPGTVDLSEEFEVAYRTGDTETEFLAFETAKRNRAVIEVAVSDGLMATVGVKFLRMHVIVTDWKRGEAYGDLVKCKIKLQPAMENDGHPPAFGVVAAP